MKLEAVEYINLITNKEKSKAEEYLSSFSDREKVRILMDAKTILADLAIRNGADMSGKCYTCKYRKNIPGDCHSSCGNQLATVKADPYGIRKGWFFHPFNFDPIWLRYCDGYAV